MRISLCHDDDNSFSMTLDFRYVKLNLTAYQTPRLKSTLLIVSWMTIVTLASRESRHVRAGFFTLEAPNCARFSRLLLVVAIGHQNEGKKRCRYSYVHASYESENRKYQ